MLAVAWGMAVLLSLPQCFVFSLKFHPEYPWYGQCVTYGTFDTRLQVIEVIQISCVIWESGDMCM